MDVKYLNTILDAFTNVLPQLGMNDIKKQGMNVKSKFINSPGVVVIIGLMGDIKGNIIYGISENDAKKIASNMMHSTVTTFDEIAQSAISELVNMLTANAATNFYNNNIKIDISTPTLICGDFTANVNTDKVICVNISVNDAIIEANIALEQ